MLDDTHGVFIKGEIHKVLLGKLEKSISVDDGEQSDNLLDEVSRIWMTGQLEKVFLNTLTHQLVFLIISEEINQGLNSVSTLLVPNDIGDVFMKALHNFEPLSVTTDAE